MVSHEHEGDLWTQRISLLHQFCCGCVALCMAVVAYCQPPLGAALSRDTTHVFQIPGLQLSVPGVVSGSLSKSWTVPTGYGDVVGGILAIVAVIALARMATWAIAAVWIFNVWVTADVLYAPVNGLRIGLDPGSL